MKEYELDPETGIRKIADWGSACARGFVSNARYSPTDNVIPRTNRNISRKWRAVDGDNIRPADTSKKEPAP